MSRYVVHILYKYTCICSDGWNTRQDVVMYQEDVARGGFSIQLASPPYEPFEQHYLSLKPDVNLVNPWFKEFWQHKFHCNYNTSNSKYKQPCTGTQSF